MLSSFEKLAWVLCILVVLLVVSASILLKPTMILTCEIESRPVEPKKFEEDWERYVQELKTVRGRRDTTGEATGGREAGSSSIVRKNYEKISGRYPDALKKSFYFADRKVIEKYSSWQELIQLVKNDRAVFLEDEEGRIVAIRIESLSENSPLRTHVRLEEGDEIVSICGYLPSDLSEGEQLFNALKNEEYFYLEVERKGRRMLLLYHVPYK